MLGSLAAWVFDDPATTEGCAEHLLRVARLDALEAPTLGAIVAGLGWNLDPWSPPGHHGRVIPETSTIYYDGRDPVAGRAHLRHECGHLAGIFGCYVHDEAGADRMGEALVCPRAAVVRAVGDHGLDAPALIGRFPDSDPLATLIRAAMFAPFFLSIWDGDRRTPVYGAEHLAMGAVPGEASLVLAVRTSGQAVLRARSSAWMLPREGRRPVVAVLCDVDAVVAWRGGEHRQP